jgi:NADH:ubiquinone oxidoreductase subunit D
MILKIFLQKMAKNGVFWLKAVLNCANIVHTYYNIGFFRRKSAKIAEISDHNIDPSTYVCRYVVRTNRICVKAKCTESLLQVPRSGYRGWYRYDARWLWLFT